MNLQGLSLKNIDKRIIKIATHALVWSIAIVSTLVETDNYVFQLNFDKVNFPIWITYLYVFYVSYFLLIPKFFFKKRSFAYIILTFLLVASGYMGVKSLHMYQKDMELVRFISHAKNIIKNDSINTPNELKAAFEGHLYDDGAPSPNRTPYFLNSKKELQKEVNKMDSALNRGFNYARYNPFSMRNIGLLYGILFILSLSIIIRFSERTKKEEERAQALQREKVTSELEYLKQQINPHFLFNALNSIYSLTILNSESSSDAVLKLSSILRYMLYETDKDKVQLDEEIEVIENYLGLQSLRLTKMTKVNFKKDGDFSPFRIEPMLLIPILENAFKYGIDSSKDSEIIIDLSIDELNMLHFSCSNVIVKQNSDNKNSGIGIKNIRRRLDLLYCDNYTFITQKEGDKFVVDLKLPLM